MRGPIITQFEQMAIFCRFRWHFFRVHASLCLLPDPISRLLRNISRSLYTLTHSTRAYGADAIYLFSFSSSSASSSFRYSHLFVWHPKWSTKMLSLFSLSLTFVFLPCSRLGRCIMHYYFTVYEFIGWGGQATAIRRVHLCQNKKKKNRAKWSRGYHRAVADSQRMCASCVCIFSCRPGTLSLATAGKREIFKKRE